jgi:hypothetical protein|tara:strand:- start:37 stop:501 length:465 start_codon:yes stop_codon:yes gene_type:complete
MKRFLLILIFLPIFLFGQGFEKNSISGNILGSSSILGVTYERSLSNHIIIEFGVGIVGIGAGINYYISEIKTESWCPYVGLKCSTLALVDVGGGILTYIPFGVTFFTSSKLKLNIGADIGPSYAKWISSDFMEFESTETETFSLHGNLKIGIRF